MEKQEKLGGHNRYLDEDYKIVTNALESESSDLI